MDVGGVDAILTVLADASTTAYDLCAQRIGNAEVEKISGAVQENGCLTQLSLACNCLGLEGARILADLLRRNETLRCLDLHGCMLGDRGTACLAESLHTNTTLQELILDCNNITSVGAESLALALEVNHCLSSLSLAANRIGAEGVECLLRALQRNSHLRDVNVAYNGVEQHDLEKLQAALQQKSLGDPPSHQPLLAGNVAEQVRALILGGDVDAVVGFVQQYCESTVLKYKRYIQTLSSHLQDHRFRGPDGLCRDCKSQATSPPLLGSFCSRPGDATSIWDPMAISSWEPLLLFPGPPQLRDDSLPTFNLPTDDWSQPRPKPRALDWDPLFLFSADPAEPNASFACSSDAMVSDGGEGEAEPSAGPPGPQTYLAACQRTLPSPSKACGVSQLDAASSEGGDEDPTDERPKDPTRISNLRRRLQRIQLTKQKLLEACDPPPDHRQIAAIAAEADILREIEQYEKYGTWAPAAAPKPPKPKRPRRPLHLLFPQSSSVR